MLGRSLLMQASGARLLYPGYVQDYLDRVTAADVGAGNTLGLERGVTDAFNTCLQALVADGILGVSGGVLTQAASLIKASCAMQGARTLSGALVPLADDMPKPTNLNFVAGDYNRRTGLGDPVNASKYLNTNRNNNADPQANRHIALRVNLTSSAVQLLLGARVEANGTGASLIGWNGTQPIFRSVPLADALQVSGSAAVGTPTMFALSRNTSSSYTARVSGSSTLITSTSTTPDNINSFVFAQNNDGSPSGFSTALINFYSLGSALDLAILDARITALSNAIQAAIAP
jgi:hypothetical protein